MIKSAFQDLMLSDVKYVKLASVRYYCMGHGRMPAALQSMHPTY